MPIPARPARAAHACCFGVAVLVTGHAVLAVAAVLLAEPHAGMDGPSRFAAYGLLLLGVAWLVAEAVVCWSAALLAARTYPRDLPAAAVVVVLCGVALLHGLFALRNVGDLPVAYTVTHVAVVVLVVVTIRLLSAAHQTLPEDTGGAA